MRTNRPIATVMLVISVCFATAANAGATLSIGPIAQTTTIGTVVTVDVAIANVTNLYGYQFDLTFSPSILRAVSSSEGPFLASGGSTFFLYGSNNNVGGTVNGTSDTLLGAVQGVTGSGGLAVFTFDTIGKGTSALAIQNATLLDSNLDSIADTTKGGSVTVTGATKAPEMDPGWTLVALTMPLGGLSVLRGRHSRSIKPVR